MQQLAVLEGAEEFSLGQGPTGCLLIHGFTGSPQSLRPVGDYLAARDIGCFALRLPGHGTTWEDLNSRSSEEWAGAADAALTKMKAEHDEVFIVSLSFGSAVALHLAANRPDDVAGIVGLASFVLTNDPRRFLSPIIKLVAKSLPGVGNDICDPNAKELCYDRLPTSAAWSMLKFCKDVRAEMPQVRCPVLLIHSRNDHTAHPDSSRFIHDHISSTDKELIWLDRSYHVITLDYEKDTVFEKTYEFISKRSRSGRD
ncbi:MAG TPA: alpha/beta fold hydrolase [Actinomycetota bacterium]|nr:alpha/beta fold hydrolase [Actinomycetota bacterium]